MKSRSIIRNTSALFLAHFIGRAITFALTIILPRYLPGGLEDMGKYFTALWLAGLLVTITELGLHTPLIREVASDRSSSSRMISNALVIRLIISAIAYILMAGIAGIAYPREIAILIYILGASGLINAIAQLMRCIFRSFERMDIEALGVILERVLVFSIGVWMVISGRGIVSFCMVVLAVSVLNLLLTLSIMMWKFGRPSIELLDMDLCKYLLKQALPFALSGALSALYFRIDGLMLKHIVGAGGDLAIGWYATGYSFIVSLTIIPGAFMGAVFPVMSRMLHSSDSAVNFLYTKSLKLMFIIALPMAVGITFLADGIVLLLYPLGETITSQDQVALSQVFEILSWANALMFLNFIFITVFRAANKRRAFLTVMIASVVVNVASNIILIPAYGHIGTSVSMIISEISIFICSFWYVQKHVCKLRESGFVIKSIFASCVMAAGLFIWKYTIWNGEGMQVLLSIFVAAIIYFAVMLAMRGINREDIDMLRGQFRGL